MTANYWSLYFRTPGFPAWSRDTRQLFFRTADGRIVMAAYMVQGDSFAPAKPQVWSEKRPADPGGNRNFDPAPDGMRIVALMDVDSLDEQDTRNHVIFLQNFFDELRRRVPVK